MIKVVDVSGWQSDNDGNSLVDWQGLVDEGITGVIIKIGQSTTFSNDFIDHVNKAVQYGLKYGVYTFSKATSTDEAVQEAKSVDSWIKEYLNGQNPELGIWFDAEDESMTNGSDSVTAICSAFISKLNEIGYNYVGIYSGWKWLSKESAEHQIDIDELADYVPYWVAQYNSHNDLADEYPNANIVMWQYTDKYSDDLPYDAEEYYTL